MKSRASEQDISGAAVKNSAAKGGIFVKDKTMAGASYLKERDWTREKEIAGKAGTATKTSVAPNPRIVLPSFEYL